MFDAAAAEESTAAATARVPTPTPPAATSSNVYTTTTTMNTDETCDLLLGHAVWSTEHAAPTVEDDITAAVTANMLASLEEVQVTLHDSLSEWGVLQHPAHIPSQGPQPEVPLLLPPQSSHSEVVPPYSLAVGSALVDPPPVPIAGTQAAHASTSMHATDAVLPAPSTPPAVRSALSAMVKYAYVDPTVFDEPCNNSNSNAAADHNILSSALPAAMHAATRTRNVRDPVEGIAAAVPGIAHNNENDDDDDNDEHEAAAAKDTHHHYKSSRTAAAAAADKDDDRMPSRQHAEEEEDEEVEKVSGRGGRRRANARPYIKCDLCNSVLPDLDDTVARHMRREHRELQDWLDTTPAAAPVTTMAVGDTNDASKDKAPHAGPDAAAGQLTPEEYETPPQVETRVLSTVYRAYYYEVDEEERRMTAEQLHGHCDDLSLEPTSSSISCYDPEDDSDEGNAHGQAGTNEAAEREGRDAGVIALGQLALRIARQADRGPAHFAVIQAAHQQLNTLLSRTMSNQPLVFLFGSCVSTGVWDGLGDADFTIVVRDILEHKRYELNKHAESAVLLEAARKLRSSGFQFEELEPVHGARIPVLKRARHLKQPYSVSRADEPYYVEVIFDTVPRATYFRVREQSRPGFNKTFQYIKDYVATSNHRNEPVGDVVAFTSGVDAMQFFRRSEENGVQKRWMPHGRLPEIFSVDFDLSCRIYGVRNSWFLRAYLAQSPLFRVGYVFLKRWSKQSGINHSRSGYLTSYAVCTLWIYFLLRRGLAAFVAPESIRLYPTKAQLSVPYMPIWNSPEGEAGDFAGSRAEEAQLRQVGRLLRGFFAFYAKFNWAGEVVTLRRDCSPHAIRDVQRVLQLPPSLRPHAFLPAKEQAQAALREPGITRPQDLHWTRDQQVDSFVLRNRVFYDICIEDVYEDNLNLGRHLSPCKAAYIKHQFRTAFTHCRNAAAALSAASNEAHKTDKAPVLRELAALLDNPHDRAEAVMRVELVRFLLAQPQGRATVRQIRAALLREADELLRIYELRHRLCDLWYDEAEQRRDRDGAVRAGALSSSQPPPPSSLPPPGTWGLVCRAQLQPRHRQESPRNTKATQTFLEGEEEEEDREEEAMKDITHAEEQHTAALPAEYDDGDDRVVYLYNSSYATEHGGAAAATRSAKTERPHSKGSRPKAGAAAAAGKRVSESTDSGSTAGSESVTDTPPPVMVMINEADAAHRVDWKAYYKKLAKCRAAYQRLMKGVDLQGISANQLHSDDETGLLRLAFYTIENERGFASYDDREQFLRHLGHIALVVEEEEKKKSNEAARGAMGGGNTAHSGSSQNHSSNITTSSSSNNNNNNSGGNGGKGSVKGAKLEQKGGHVRMERELRAKLVHRILHEKPAPPQIDFALRGALVNVIAQDKLYVVYDPATQRLVGTAQLRKYGSTSEPEPAVERTAQSHKSNFIYRNTRQTKNGVCDECQKKNVAIYPASRPKIDAGWYCKACWEKYVKAQHEAEARGKA